MSERRRILSIDGGGVRGIIPATVLAKLEETTRKKTREHFDFLTGTSTGAVIAGALAVGIPAQKLVTLYERRGRELFRKIWGLSLLKRFFLGHMYSVDQLNRMLSEELEGHAEVHLNALDNDIMITAKGLLDGHAWYFVKDRIGEGPGKTGELLLTDCVTASAAAPTYFAPWTINDIGVLVDGGTGVAGNPVYQACVEAFEYIKTYKPAETVVVSLGTGRYLERTPPTWLPSWLTWILSELLRSPGEQQTELVKRHYRSAKFYRIDAALKRDFQLDSIGELEELRRVGSELAKGVNWKAILAGQDDESRIVPKKVQARDYARAV